MNNGQNGNGRRPNDGQGGGGAKKRRRKRGGRKRRGKGGGGGQGGNNNGQQQQAGAAPPAAPGQGRGGRGRGGGGASASDFAAARGGFKSGQFSVADLEGRQLAPGQSRGSAAAAPIGGNRSKQAGPPPAKLNPHSRTSSTTRAALSGQRFDTLPLSGEVKRAISDVLHYETMTKCQAESLPVSLRNNCDVLCKAKTGTGKTLGFMIPAVELMRNTPAARRRGRVSVLCVSPTRELACQIRDEGQQLLSFLPGVELQVVYGGTNVKRDISKFRQRWPDILVGTPGRLNDHLENNGLAQAMAGPGGGADAGLKLLIFDEADQLLEMGFRPAITRMLGMLPPKATRQCLLFSATMPPSIQAIAKFALRAQPPYAYVDCVGADQSTHQRVPQHVTVHPVGDQFAELHAVLEEAMRADPDDYKVLVFFVTARLTQLFAELFNLMGMNRDAGGVLEIHSRKSQSHRSKSSDKFRDGFRKIMFTSDVTARGMDYPDVTRVIQVGLPSGKEQYIHRLGRTARAGKGGCGVLLLCDFESQFFLRQLGDQPTIRRQPAGPGGGSASFQGNLSQALDRLPEKTLSMGYQAWLGFYNSHLRKLRWSQRDLVDRANDWVLRCCRAREPPSLMARARIFL